MYCLPCWDLFVFCGFHDLRGVPEWILFCCQWVNSVYYMLSRVLRCIRDRAVYCVPSWVFCSFRVCIVRMSSWLLLIHWSGTLYAVHCWVFLSHRVCIVCPVHLLFVQLCSAVCLHSPKQHRVLLGRQGANVGTGGGADQWAHGW